jgi:hypothetical protein
MKELINHVFLDPAISIQQVIHKMSGELLLILKCRATPNPAGPTG